MGIEFAETEIGKYNQGTHDEYKVECTSKKIRVHKNSTKQHVAIKIEHPYTSK